MSYHTYKHIVFSRIQETILCKKMNEKVKPKKHKKYNHQQQDNDIHQFHKFLDMVDGSVNTSDYNIPQVHPKPVEPTYSVLEVLKSHLVAPPSLEGVKEELETEPQQQLSEQDDIAVAEEDQLAPVDKNEQCLKNQFGIKILECDENTRTGMGYRTTIELKPIPKSQCADPQVDIVNENLLDVQLADSNGEETLKMPPSSSHSIPASDEPEEAAPLTTHYVDTIVEMEIHRD